MNVHQIWTKSSHPFKTHTAAYELTLHLQKLIATVGKWEMEGVKYSIRIGELEKSSYDAI